jgi:hypothetical protein
MESVERAELMENAKARCKVDVVCNFDVSDEDESLLSRGLDLVAPRVWQLMYGPWA